MCLPWDTLAHVYPGSALFVFQPLTITCDISSQARPACRRDPLFTAHCVGPRGRLAGGRMAAHVMEDCERPSETAIVRLLIGLSFAPIFGDNFPESWRSDNGSEYLPLDMMPQWIWFGTKKLAVRLRDTQQPIRLSLGEIDTMNWLFPKSIRRRLKCLVMNGNLCAQHLQVFSMWCWVLRRD